MTFCTEDAFEEEINDGPPATSATAATAMASRPTSAVSPRTPGVHGPCSIFGKGTLSQARGAKIEVLLYSMYIYIYII